MELAVARFDERLDPVGARDEESLPARKHLALGRAPGGDADSSLGALHELDPVALPGTERALLELLGAPLLFDGSGTGRRPGAEQVAGSVDHLDAEQRIGEVPLVLRIDGRLPIQVGGEHRLPAPRHQRQQRSQPALVRDRHQLLEADSGFDQRHAVAAVGLDHSLHAGEIHHHRPGRLRRDRRRGGAPRS